MIGCIILGCCDKFSYTLVECFSQPANITILLIWGRGGYNFSVYPPLTNNWGLYEQPKLTTKIPMSRMLYPLKVITYQSHNFPICSNLLRRSFISISVVFVQSISDINWKRTKYLYNVTGWLNEDDRNGYKTSPL